MSIVKPRIVRRTVFGRNRKGANTIGGMFGLAEPIPSAQGNTPPFLTESSVLCANASSGIALLAARLTPIRVWLPSYLCGAVRAALGRCDAKTIFYELDYDLTMRSSAWVGDVQRGDLIVVIDYFGYPCAVDCDEVRARGGWVLEDASQALLSGHVGRHADFVVFSPRKFLGVPDGGILVTKDLAIAALRDVPERWWLKALAAATGRRDFDLHGGANHWFKLFQEIEANRPIGSYAMSQLSRLLLVNCFDYRAIAKRRIANYRRLSQTLSDVALFPSLPSGVVPLGFPIRVRNRRSVLQSLFNEQIFPPVHWPLHGVVPKVFKDSHRLARNIMTLPCDQRYDYRDMDRMGAIVRTAILS